MTGDGRRVKIAAHLSPGGDSNLFPAKTTIPYLHRAASGGDPDFRALCPGEALLRGVTLVRSRLYARIQQNSGPGRMSPRCVCYGFLHSLGGAVLWDVDLSLIHISEPTRLRRISYAVFCLKKKKKQ